MLGALGLLIGTIGLGVLIFRTTFEQVPQFALLQSVGFSKTKIYRLVVGEKLLVVAVAVLIGLIPAFLSGLPTLFSPLYAGYGTGCG
jgi:ABC-type antimicrobial peptide transport system permease subunit